MLTFLSFSVSTFCVTKGTLLTAKYNEFDYLERFLSPLELFMIEQPELANGIEMDRTDCCMASAYASFQNLPQQTLGPTQYLLSCFIIIYLGENLTWESIYARYDNDLPIQHIDKFQRIFTTNARLYQSGTKLIQQVLKISQ